MIENKPDGQALQQRKNHLIQQLSQFDLSKDIHGSLALIRLAAGVDIQLANQKLRDVASWFILPHPTGRDPYGENDFAAIKLCWAYYHFGKDKLLEEQTLTAIRQYFLCYDFQSKYVSENHRLLFHTSRYLMGNAYPEDVFGRYGFTGRQLAELERVYLLDFFSFRASQGWEEFDSGNYLAPVWECLCALHDFAPDQRVRIAAKMMMNIRLVDVLEDSLEGMHCGAHGRIYTRQALDHRYECSFFLQALYFGNVTVEPMDSHPVNYVVEALLSSFVPEPLLFNITFDRTFPYESKERVHLHCSTYRAPQRPLPQEPGSIQKVTYLTCDYAIGCVQWQDAYPQDSLAAWYSGHQQHNWDVTFAGGDTRRRIFTHHPGKNGAEGAEHGYWTGDMFCNCSSHFQAGTAVLSMYDIHESEPYQWIHAYLPRSLFEEVVYQGTSIYVRYKHVYAMVRFAHPYHWVEEGPWADIEVICDGAQNGAVCEVGTALTHGSFMSFISEMEKNNMKLDENNMWLIYDSKRNGHIRLTRADRFIDGKSVAFNYDTYDSPYMHAGWDEGVVRIQFGGKTLVCDFKHMAMTIAEHK